MVIITLLFLSLSFALQLKLLTFTIAFFVIILLRFQPRLILPALIINGAILGNHFQIFVFSLFLIGQIYQKKLEVERLGRFKYFLILLFGWLSVEFYQQFQLSSLINYWKIYGFVNYSGYFNSELSHFIQSLKIFANLFLIIISFEYFKNFKVGDFKNGMLLGIGCSQVLTIYQIFFNPIFLNNQSSFWDMQQRYPSTFSDPNAFGICSFFLIGFLIAFISERKFDYKIFLLVSIQFILTLYSGSRTFLLAMVVSLACWSYLKNKRYFLIGTSAVFLLVLLINLGFFIANPDIDSQLPFLPAGLNRLVSSLRIDNLSQTFFSRQVFNQLNLLIFKDYPIFGVGLNQFDQTLPLYKDFLTKSIGSWVDNNNNFYFGLLTELGLVGFLTFIWGCSSFCYKQTANKLLAIFFFVFLSLLFLGPHFYFTEVSLLFGLLLSQIVTRNKFNEKAVPPFYKLLIIGILFIGIWNNSRYRSIGTYALEKDLTEEYYWSKQESNLFLDCSKFQGLQLKEVSDSSQITELKIYRFSEIPFFPLTSSSQDLISGQFECPNKLNKYKIFFRLSGTWQPNLVLKNSLDPRFLGLKIIPKAY